MSKVLFYNKLLLIFFVTLSSCSIRECQERKIEELETEIAELTGETIFLKFRVEAVEADQFKVDLRFFDRSEEVVAVMDDILVTGNELIIEYLMIRLGKGGNYIAFPHRLYSDTVPPKHGVELVSAYFDQAKQEVPLIYSGGETLLSDKTGKYIIEQLSGFLYGSLERTEYMFINERKDTGAWGVHAGRIYSVVSRIRGGIEIKDGQ